MTKRFIINEFKDRFTLLNKKSDETLFESKDFNKIMSKPTNEVGKDTIYGIIHIKDPYQRHDKFKDFKTPVRCFNKFK